MDVFEKLEKRGKHLAITGKLICPAILSIISDTLWPNAHLNLFLGYTSSCAARNLRFVEDINKDNIHISQVITLQDDNIGSLPQVVTGSLYRLINFGIEKNWEGYCTRFWPIGDLDPVSLFLSKASWNVAVTPEKAYSIYAKRLYGEGLEAQLFQAFKLLEDATVILDIDMVGIFPNKNCISTGIGKDKDNIMSENFKVVLSIYKEVRHIFLKLFSSVESPQARSHTLYWIGRMDFSINILCGISIIEKGNRKLRDNDMEFAKKLYNDAISNFTKALEIISENVKDDSDKGTLAIYYDVLIREVRKKVQAEIDMSEEKMNETSVEQSR